MFRDIYSLLYGMRCEHLAKLFHDTDVDLVTFLSLTDEKLKNIGVKLPFQRRRILSGLHTFHKHSFKIKSIPVVAKNEVYR